LKYDAIIIGSGPAGSPLAYRFAELGWHVALIEKRSAGGELIHVLYTMMLGNLPYALLKGGVFIPPTLCEGFFTLLDSVKAVN
jgi:pyruvate/2-oxoglutarate dehydrogenase complex dihydrolipoamide dehydrogenase (E3) component